MKFKSTKVHPNTKATDWSRMSRLITLLTEVDSVTNTEWKQNILYKHLDHFDYFQTESINHQLNYVDIVCLSVVNKISKCIP